MKGTDLYTPLPTTKDDWIASLGYAKWLMDYRFDVPLKFDKSEHLIDTKAEGGILSDLEGIYINIDQDVAFHETSRNFREIALSYGISGIITSNSPLGFFYSIIPHILKIRHANKGIYKALNKRNQGNPKERMHNFAKEALDLYSEERPSDEEVEMAVEAYIMKYMPYVRGQ